MSNQKPIYIKVLETNLDFVKVKLPFLDVPVSMNREFFNKRLKNGYFHILEAGA